MAGRILIVDDDIDTLQLVGTMLERQGYQILAANNGLKAIETAHNEIPDLILLDIMMPGMDGYEVARRLRAMENTAFIPIIMFTAKAQVDDKVEGFEAGADDYLTKPTHPAELLARVKKIMNRPQTGTLKPSGDRARQFQKGHMIGVLAAKGGLGVSTLALNLGVTLHQQTDEYVIVAELRPGQGGVGLYLGYPQSEILSDFLRRDPREIKLHDVVDSLVAHGSGVQLLLSSYQPADVDLIQALEQIETVIGHLSRIAPFVVLDLGVGLPEATRMVIDSCDQLIVVLEPARHSILQTAVLLQNLEERGVKKRDIDVVLINRMRMEITIPATQVQSELGRNLATVLTPAPELAYQAAEHHQPMVMQQPKSLTAQQIAKLAERVTERLSMESV